MAPIAAPTDDPAATGLGEIIRARVSRAGLPPGTSAPGELAATVVDAVGIAGAEGQKNWLAQALSALGRAVQVTTGFAVTGKAFRTGDTHEPCIMLEIKVVRTGATYDVVTGRGSTYDLAAINAAYELYLSLARRPSVATRTPSWLAWTSVDALRLYQDARFSMSQENFLDALDHLDHARLHQPGNLLVTLQHGLCAQSIADGTLDEKVLRHDDLARRQEHQILSLRDFLQAALCAPGNDDAVAWAAVALSYVPHWVDAFCRPVSPDTRAVRRQVVWLLEQVSDQCGLGERGFPGSVEPLLNRMTADDFPAGDIGDKHVEVVTQFREMAIGLWKWSVRRQRCQWAMRRSLRLAHRLEMAGRVHPFSSLRLARRYSAIGNLLATKWDRAVNGGQVTDRTKFRLGLTWLRAWFGMWLVRPRFRRTPLYNMTVTWARQSLAAGGSEAAEQRREAIRLLTRATIGPSARLSAEYLDDLSVDPDLQELRHETEFDRWVARFDPAPGNREQRVWTELASHVCEGARTCMDAWAAREIQLAALVAPGPGLGWLQRVRTSEVPANPVDVINWFRHDLQMWECLVEWKKSPSVAKHRLAFDRLRSTMPTAGGALEAPGPTDVKIHARGQWQELIGDAATNATNARTAMEQVEEAALQGQVRPLVALVLALAGPARGRWGRTVAWSGD